MNVEVRYSDRNEDRIELLICNGIKRQSEAIHSFDIRYSLFDIRHSYF